MSTLLFLFTLVTGNHCIVWLPNTGNYDFSNFPIVASVDVYDANAISDTLADQLFVNVYTVSISGINQVVQCD